MSTGKSRPSPQLVLQAPPPLGHTGSLRQKGEQPSPVSLLPSSHSSEPSLVPLPQVVRAQAWPGVRHCQPSHSVGPAGSSTHSELQPSPLFMLPSSHCSGPTLMPSPQRVGRQAAPDGQVQPVSTAQTAEQPSPAVLLPSSQVSPPVTLRSPHTTVETHGDPGVGQTQLASTTHWALQPSEPF